ncbi:hypothetical protein C0J52_17304 [Blattella germanica]|nr:hypothetical protein C0J52_17304 [Blattella germanica]
MTEGVLHQLFEIGFNAPAARSLCVNIRELPVITEQLAKARNRPEIVTSIRIKPYNCTSDDSFRGQQILKIKAIMTKIASVGGNCFDWSCIQNHLIKLASVREGLHRLIAADIKAEKRKPRYVGFGTTLKPPLRYNPPNNETQKKWVDLPAVPDDLATHRAVWEGITALR